MAKAISTHIVRDRSLAREESGIGRKMSGPGSWLLLGVSVAVATVLAISVPRLITPGGWMTCEKFLFVALVAYLGASAFYLSSLGIRHSGLMAGAVALARGGGFV